MWLVQDPEANWLNSLSSQARVEEKQCIREQQINPQLGIGEKEGRKEENQKEKKKRMEENKRKAERNKYSVEKYNWLQNSQSLLKRNPLCSSHFLFRWWMYGVGRSLQRKTRHSHLCAQVLQGCSLLPYATTHWYSDQHCWQYSRWDPVPLPATDILPLLFFILSLH